MGETKLQAEGRRRRWAGAGPQRLSTVLYPRWICRPNPTFLQVTAVRGMFRFNV
jgi:hypothetical protein